MLHTIASVTLLITAVFGSRVVVDRPDAWPTAEWKELGRAKPDQEITLVSSLQYVACFVTRRNR